MGEQGFADEAEAGGGLMVAVVQLAITLGAAAGGVLFDRWGYQATFLSSAALLIVIRSSSHSPRRRASCH